MIKNIIRKGKEYSSKLFRESICSTMRSNLKNIDFSMISSNCIGGILCHDLGLEFRSPTINLYFDAEGFVRFCENMPHYLSAPLELDQELTDKKGYPVIKLDDIIINAVHYKSFEDFVQQWKRRAARVNYNNLFIVMTDRNGCTNDHVKRLSYLPYPKVLFSCRPMTEYDFVIHVPGFEQDGEVGQLHFFTDVVGNRYYEKHFDFVGWLNKG